MENWFRSLFLSSLILGCSLISPSVLSADEGAKENDVLIQPEVDRLDFNEAQIDSNDLELMFSAGYLSIEDFGVNPLLAFKLNYHVNEMIFIQLTLAQSEGSETSYEVINPGAPLLTDEERELQYYSINIGYNFLPGEAFLSENTTFNTVFYLSAGIGNTEFAGSDEFTYNYGGGYRFLLNDAFSVTTEFRNNVFDMDVFGLVKRTNNLELTVGLGWFF